MAFLLKNIYSPTFQDSQQEIIAILHGYIKKKYVICIINESLCHIIEGSKGYFKI